LVYAVHAALQYREETFNGIGMGDVPLDVEMGGSALPALSR
jgi:hypothetical protein